MKEVIIISNNCNDKCKKEVQKFEEKHVRFGVVEKKNECKECEFIDASNIYQCLDCEDK